MLLCCQPPYCLSLYLPQFLQMADIEIEDTDSLEGRDLFLGQVAGELTNQLFLPIVTE